MTSQAADNARRIRNAIEGNRKSSRHGTTVAEAIANAREAATKSATVPLTVRNTYQEGDLVLSFSDRSYLVIEYRGNDVSAHIPATNRGSNDAARLIDGEIQPMSPEQYQAYAAGSDLQYSIQKRFQQALDNLAKTPGEETLAVMLRLNDVFGQALEKTGSNGQAKPDTPATHPRQ